MKTIIQKLLISFLLDSNKYEFKNYDFDEVAEELEPLFKSLIENYFYLKSQNPKNIPMEKFNFIKKPD
jgi:hypothetical protein